MIRDLTHEGFEMVLMGKGGKCFFVWPPLLVFLALEVVVILE